jgi:hypothetical protein
LSDGNCIDAPALAGDAAIASHPPAQYKGGAVRETHRGRDKSARVAGPCLTTSERIAAASTDRAIVTAGNKAAKRKNVLKRISTVRTDFQHPAVKPVLQVKVVAEGYPHRAGIADSYYIWRKKLLVADRARIIYERSIGQ